jgi:cyclopropane fatty-acyl-phospholipid synthase-like methyltransferase
MTDDPWRLSAIAHAEIELASPLTSSTLDALLDTLGDLRGARALDVGCGSGELLVRLTERGADATGYDVSPYAVERARARIDQRVPHSAATVLEAAEPPPGPFDVVTSVGASGAISPGSVPGAVKRLRDLLAPGGRLLFADGYWRRRPDPGYLAALGATAEEMSDLDGLVEAAEDAGLTVVHVVEVTEEDWAAYEQAWGDGLRSHVEQHPDDPDAARFIDRARLQGAAFERWGRDTLGFAALVCRQVDDGAPQR